MSLFKSSIFTMTLTGLLIMFGWQTAYAEANQRTKPVKVQAEDTLEEVAWKYGGTTKMWEKVNFLDEHYLTIGHILHIVSPYRVQAGDKLDYLAGKYNTTTFAIKNLNHLKTEELATGMVLSIPVNSNKMSKERERFAEKYSKKIEQPKKQTVKKEIKKETTKEQKQVDTQPKQKKQEQKKQERKSEQTVNTSGKSTFQMRATAYNVEGNEKWGKLTASGTTVHHGVVAVDPDVIPLGTKLYISGYDSPLLPKGGFIAIAEDTGGAIKGKRIDIFIDAPTGTVSDFGIQNVKVTILK